MPRLLTCRGSSHGDGTGLPIPFPPLPRRPVPCLSARARAYVHVHVPVLRAFAHTRLPCEASAREGDARRGSPAMSTHSARWRRGLQAWQGDQAPHEQQRRAVTAFGATCTSATQPPVGSFSPCPCAPPSRANGLNPPPLERNESIRPCIGGQTNSHPGMLSPRSCHRANAGCVSRGTVRRSAHCAWPRQCTRACQPTDTRRREARGLPTALACCVGSVRARARAGSEERRANAAALGARQRPEGRTRPGARPCHEARGAHPPWATRRGGRVPPPRSFRVCSQFWSCATIPPQSKSCTRAEQVMHTSCLGAMRMNTCESSGLRCARRRGQPRRLARARARVVEWGLEGKGDKALASILPLRCVRQGVPGLGGPSICF